MIRHKVLCFQIWKDKRILYIYRVLVLSMYVKLHFSNFETLLSFIWMIFRNILLCFLKCVLFYNQTEWYLVYENFPKLLRSGLCFAPNKTFLIIWLPLYWVTFLRYLVHWVVNSLSAGNLFFIFLLLVSGIVPDILGIYRAKNYIVSGSYCYFNF